MSVKPESLPSPLIDNDYNREIHERVRMAESLQWRGSMRIRKIQLELLKRLCTHARQYSPFYRQRLADVDIEGLNWSSFRDVPLLTRQELRDQGQAIDCTEVPEHHGKISVLRTSGSTGSPVEVRSTESLGMLRQANALRDHLWHGRDASKTMAGIRWRADDEAMAPDGWELEDWGAPHNQFYKTGAAFFLNSVSDIEDQRDWWLRRDPHYLISHPSNLRALLLLMQRGDGRPQQIEQLRTVGEQLSDDLRGLARELLDVKLVDSYSCQELGYIAMQCPQATHYHVLSDSVVVEVVRADGKPCAVGEMGQVLVTSLHNQVTPLIRYAIGDMAIPGDDCACGRGLPVLKQIAGRVRNMLLLPNGSSRWPNFGFRRFLAIADIDQFQIVQTAIDAVEFRAVVNKPLDKTQENAIADVLNEHLGFDFKVGFAYPQSIPRSASGKYEDFVSLID